MGYGRWVSVGPCDGYADAPCDADSRYMVAVVDVATIHDRHRRLGQPERWYTGARRLCVRHLLQYLDDVLASERALGERMVTLPADVVQHLRGKRG